MPPLQQQVPAFFKRTLPNRFARFLLVGGLNTVFGYAVFALFVFVGLHYAVAALASTVLGVLFNFMTTGNLVFDRAHPDRFVRFALVYCVLYFVNVFGLKLGKGFGYNEYVSCLALIAPSALLAYTLQRSFVFSR